MELSNNLFEIRNLKCAYGQGGTVLHIDHLEVEKSKMYFILGQSGIGKSTFIETLGLMNQTIQNQDEASILYSADGNSQIELSQLWKKGDETLAAFRQSHFSFIFQNTNLMPNLTAGENVCISMLLGGGTFSEASERVKHAFSELDLSPDKFDTKVSELSGGERQRVAFVRGILSNYEVLFGDEPTGNLDKKSAFSAMRGLKEALYHSGKTSLIVTHDPNLALEFGDGIIFITQEFLKNKKIYGIIHQDSFIFKNNGNWLSSKNEIIKNASAHISSQLNYN